MSLNKISKLVGSWICEKRTPTEAEMKIYLDVCTAAVNYAIELITPLFNAIAGFAEKFHNVLQENGIYELFEKYIEFMEEYENGERRE